MMIRIVTLFAVVLGAVVLGAVVLAGTAFADDESSRAKLIGAWQQTEAGGKDTVSTWVLKDLGDSMHVTGSNATQTVMDFECATVGKDCDVKESGRHAKISLWFNGPKLVELETRGTLTVKRRFTVTGDGDTMDLETIPIVPAGKTETVHFKRVQPTAAKR
jgi:hypothetical protein